jgi:hypothetical protein
MFGMAIVLKYKCSCIEAWTLPRLRPVAEPPKTLQKDKKAVF